jgi:BirA family transcriptional regulator, biotin operon repressor / biotin---[acetyl-CoA-carboxylase] ligase
LSLPEALPHPQSPVPEEFAAALARMSDGRVSIVREVHWCDEVPSTNDVAAAYADRGEPEGVLVLARTQTAGRGRLGRTWQSPAGAGVYASILLRPPAHALPLLTIAAGVAIADGVRVSTGLAPTLKWPNDLYVNDRKLAGILTEAGARADGVSHAVVGFGINLRPAAYPPAVASRATSIEAELGREIGPGSVLAECLTALSSRYDDLRAGRTASVIDAWRVYARPMLRRPVEWEEAGGRRRGLAEDVDETGALVVRTDAGMVRVMSGEVRWT